MFWSLFCLHLPAPGPLHQQGSSALPADIASDTAQAPLDQAKMMQVPSLDSWLPGAFPGQLPPTCGSKGRLHFTLQHRGANRLANRGVEASKALTRSATQAYDAEAQQLPQQHPLLPAAQVRLQPARTS